MDKDTELNEFGINAAKSGGIFLSSNVISSILILAMSVFVARYLQPADFGLYTIVVAFSTFLSMGGNFGIGTAFRKYIPENKKSDVLGNMIASGYLISIAISATITIIAIAISPYIAATLYRNAALTLPLIIASITFLLSVMLNLNIAALVALKKNKKSAYSIIGYSSMEMVAAIVLVYLGFGVLGAIAGIAIGTFIGLLVSFASLFEDLELKTFKATKKMIGKLTSFSIPVVISYVFQNGIINFGILFLGIYASSFVLGNFGAAFRLGRFIEVLLASSTIVLLPTFAEAITNGFSKDIGLIYNKSVYYTFLLILPIVAYISATSVQISKLFFTSSYILTPFYLSFIVIGSTINIVGTYAGILLLGYGKAKDFMKYQLIGIIVEILLLAYLVPQHTALGLLVAIFAIGPVLMGVLYTIVLRKDLSIRIEYGRIGKLVIAAVISGFIILEAGGYINSAVFSLLKSSYLALIAVIVANIIIMAFLYPLFAAVLGAVRDRDLKFIKGVSGRIKITEKPINLIIRYTKLFIR
jgi:O-antigen/teichoic acid export membrane protein